MFYATQHANRSTVPSSGTVDMEGHLETMSKFQLRDMIDEFVCFQLAVFIHMHNHHNHKWIISYNFYVNTYPIASIYSSVLLLRYVG